MPKLSIVLNNRFMGEVELPNSRTVSGGLVYEVQRLNYLFTCPLCGKFWGMLTGTAGEYYPLRILCEGHKRSWSGQIPGSLLCSILDLTLDMLPEQLIQREAMLHLKYLENEDGQET